MSSQKSSEPLTHNDYTVGWVCALPKEQTAATAMLEKRHAKLPKPSQDPNAYTFGSIGKHNIVIACLPKGKTGTNSAATVAAWMTSTFPSIKFGLMVGIGGGIPPKVRLGDVVVGTPVGQFPGVVQGDMGKATRGGKFERTGALDNPPFELLTALATLETEHDLNGSKVPEYLDELKENWPTLAPRYLRSDSLKDVLFKANYDHVSESSTDGDTIRDDNDGDEEDEEEKSCQHCDETKVVKRKPRDMRVHYGLIASGNKVIKDATFRDKLNKDLGGYVLCVEMEAAGILTKFPCIVIRGICDYADSHKNKAWQEHAAAVAAAFAKEFLHVVEAQDVEQMPVIKLLKQFHRDEETQRILDWISPIQFRDRHTEILKDRAQGTGSWILENPHFVEWTEGKVKTLWCRGIPGAGKTVMAAIVSDYLRSEYTRDHPNIGIATLYCDYQKQDNEDLDNLERSIYQQALEYLDAIPDDIRKIYTSARIKHPPLPNVSELHSAFMSFPNSLSTIFVVLDALDEASETVQDHIVLRISDLPFTDIRLFCTSRPFSKFEDTFQKLPQIEIKATDADITTFVKAQIQGRSRLLKLVKSDEELQQEIVEEIIDKAQGMFLMAKLHIDSVMFASSKTDIREALRDLSSGIDDTYKKAMQRVRSQLPRDRQLAERTLSWVFGCRRLLNTVELQHGLAVVGLKRDREQVSKDDLPHEEIIISVCQGLLIQGPSLSSRSSVERRKAHSRARSEKKGSKEAFIRPVHYTAAEYFTKAYFEEFPQGQAEIAQACVAYLSLSRLSENLWSHLSELDKKYRALEMQDLGGGELYFESKLTRCRLEIQNCFPLFFYAGQHWGSHLCEAHLHGLPISASKIFWQYRSTSFKWEKWLVPPGKSHHTKYGDHIYSIVSMSYSAVLEVLSQLTKRGHDVNAVDDDGRTMLFYAVKAGHQNAIKFLLALDDIEINEPDSEINDPLSAAVDGNLKGVVRSLLSMIAVRGKEENDQHQEAGQDSKWPCSFYSPERLRSLQVKASGKSGLYDDREVLRMLVDKTKDFDPRDGLAFLLLAIKKGQLSKSEFLTFLLERDLDLQARDESDNTLLHMVAKTNEHILVEELLRRGADAGAVNSTGRTPLQTAVDAGSFLVFLQLLKFSTADMRRNLEFDKESSAWSGKYPSDEIERRVISLLIQEEFTSAKDLEGRTALSWAAEYPNCVAIGFFLELDWDINSCDHSGRTALSYAATHKYHEAENIVKKLLEAGADPDIKDNLGKTPILHVAERPSYYYDRDVISELLKADADVNAKDASGAVALHIFAGKYVAGCNISKMIKELLVAGMDPNVKTSSGKGKPDLFSMDDNVYREKYHELRNAQFETQIRVWMLLDAGADPNIKDADGKTPRDYALSRADHSLSVILLIHECLRLGGDVNSKDTSGKTLLFYVTESQIDSNRQVELVKALLDAGADPNIQDDRGRTPIFAAGKNEVNEVNQDVWEALGENAYDDDVWATLEKGGAMLDVKDTSGKRPKRLYRINRIN